MSLVEERGTDIGAIIENYKRLQRMANPQRLVVPWWPEPQPAKPAPRRPAFIDRGAAGIVVRDRGEIHIPSCVTKEHRSRKIAPVSSSKIRKLLKDICFWHSVELDKKGIARMSRLWVSPTALSNPLKIAPVAHARRDAIYYLHDRYRLSYPQLGRLFKRHHTSAMHAYVSKKAAIDAGFE